MKWIFGLRLRLTGPYLTRRATRTPPRDPALARVARRRETREAREVGRSSSVDAFDRFDDAHPSGPLRAATPRGDTLLADARRTW